MNALLATFGDLLKAGRVKRQKSETELPDVGIGEDPIWLPSEESQGGLRKSTELAMQLEPLLREILREVRKDESRSPLEPDSDFEKAAKLLVKLTAQSILGQNDRAHVLLLGRRHEVHRRLYPPVSSTPALAADCKGYLPNFRCQPPTARAHPVHLVRHVCRARGPDRRAPAGR